MADTAFEQASLAHQQDAASESARIARKLDDVRAQQAYARVDGWARAPIGTRWASVQITPLHPAEEA